MIATRLPNNLYYLTDQFPPKYGYIKKAVNLLKYKGLRSNSGKEYTSQILLNVVRGMHTDDKVKGVLEEMVATYQGVKTPVPAPKIKSVRKSAVAA